MMAPEQTYARQRGISKYSKRGSVRRWPCRRPRRLEIRFDILKVDDNEMVTARLTNRLRTAIVIQIYGNGDRAILEGADPFVDTWRPRGEWRRSITAGWQFCGVGITSRKIAPDESVTLNSSTIYRTAFTATATRAGSMTKSALVG